ncbi:arylamine N-acetyltransferase family protein [Methylorubrum extorquens]
MNTLAPFCGRPRILVVGQDPQVLALVTEEVAACGLDVSGMTVGVAETASSGAFDLVAFGTGVSAETRTELERMFSAANPDARFLRTYAPYAASQIVAAVRQPQASPVDVEAYCRRIGYDGPLEPTIETLSALQERHLAAIPFEAIDVLLGRGVDISPAAVDAKLIAARRGGYCYEQNGLFKRVLRAIGFDVDGLVASVLWMAPPGAPPPPRTHMVLRVTIEGAPWLADVGFGSSVPPAPLRMDSREPQPTSHERYRLLPIGAGLLVQAEIAGEWRSLYDVSPEPLLDSHYELFNWFAAAHETSHFRRELIAARITPDARCTLLGNRLTIRPAHGEVERRRLDADGIERALADVFHLSPQPDWRGMVERTAARGAFP